MEAIGTLAGGIAHDFNNFLQVVEGHADLIRLDPMVPGKTLISVEEISRAVERCQQLTQRLLAFGRKQDNAPTLNQVHALVGATARILGKVIGDDIELKLISDPHPCTIRIDPVQFEQVLVNLTVNARDAMPDGGTLEVRVDQVHLGPELSTPLLLAPGMYCRIEVRDTGIGMTEATQLRIFEPFFTTKAVGTGTGLGLSTAHGIVHQAGGAIRVKSTLDQGSVFTLFFPVSATEPGMARVVPDSRDYPVGNETILLVEDGEDLRSNTKEQLERAGYTVLQAPNGETALDLAGRHSGPIHLLLTDVMMPRMSGPELAGRIQAKRPTACVVFMSGYTERLVLRRTALRSDRVSLHKPFSTRELLFCVREQLDSLRQT
jgi:CheY-like chemotaxis protein